MFGARVRFCPVLSAFSLPVLEHGARLAAWFLHLPQNQAKVMRVSEYSLWLLGNFRA